MTQDELIGLADAYMWKKLTGISRNGELVVLRKGKTDLWIEGNTCNVLKEGFDAGCIDLQVLRQRISRTDRGDMDPQYHQIGPFKEGWFSLKANRFVK